MDFYPGKYAAFAGAKRIAIGILADVAVASKRALDEDSATRMLVFDLATGAVTDLDLRGTEADIRARYAPAPPRRGRPKLGVTAREVTLLPRHWDWLASQPGGASVALRKLVDAARKSEGDAAGLRTQIEAAYRFMSAMAGDLPKFEDAARALFARDGEGLQGCTRGWPGDIRDQMLQMSGLIDLA